MPPPTAPGSSGYVLGADRRSVHVSTHLFVDTSILVRLRQFNVTWPDAYGQAVIDINNPLTPDYIGLTIGHSTYTAEEIARARPDIEVVKGFNTVFAQVLVAGPDFGNGRTVPVLLASDSAAAKELVTTLVRSLGFETIDTGPLKNARYLEPVGGLDIYFGYGAGLGTSSAPTWIHKG